MPTSLVCDNVATCWHGVTDNVSGSWVPLDEYYYSKQEGDPTYREEKGEFRFKVTTDM